jgi:hypothetical protein
MVRRVVREVTEGRASALSPPLPAAAGTGDDAPTTGLPPLPLGPAPAGPRSRADVGRRGRRQRRDVDHVQRVRVELHGGCRLPVVGGV